MTATGTESGLDWSEYLKPDWLARRREDAIDPDLPIVDPHHHIWDWLGYGLDAFLADLHGGHDVRATVHLESRTAWDLSAPAHLQSVGETRHLVELTKDPLLNAPDAPAVCAGIVGHVDLDQPGNLVEEALAAHLAAGRGRFKGVRLNMFYHKDVAWLDGTRPGMAADPLIRENLARLGAHGLVCDVMAFHHQLPELARLAEAVPDVPLVVNHYGGFLGRIAKHEGYAAALEVWRAGIDALARQPNVTMKLGGLTCDFFSGIQLHLAEEPPSSQVIADVYRPFFEPCVEAFGTTRCMFESNYPADRQQVDYVILWNGFKRLAAGASADEKNDLFNATARRVYALGDAGKREGATAAPATTIGS